MNYRGLIWVAGDDISTAIEATVSTDDSGGLSIVSKSDNLGSWPLDQVVVEAQGDADFLLTVGSDRIMFRPSTPAGHISFGRATVRPGGLTDRIRAASPDSPAPTGASPGPPVAATSRRAGLPGPKKSSPKLGRNLLVGLVVVLGIGYFASQGGDSSVQDTFGEISDTLNSDSPATSRATTTTRPTTTTVRSQFTEPITITGSGDDIASVDIPGDEAALMQASYSGSSNFSITSYGAGGEYLDLLVNTIGTYAGVRPMNFWDGETVVELDVTASGPWTIKLYPITAAPQMVGGSYSGSGDEVIQAATGTQATISHNGSSNFVVSAWGSSWDLLVNEIGSYSGTVRVPSGTFIFEVEADGNWTIDQG